MMPDYIKRMYWLLLTGKEDCWPTGSIPIMGLHRSFIPSELQCHIKTADLDTLLKYYMDRLRASHPECFEDEVE